MALNFLGLGFSLGAQDKGLSGAIKETSSGLADISKSVVGIGLASAKMIFKPPDLGPTIGVAKTLIGDVKTTTTALEAYGVTASKATSAGLAGLNMTNKEFSQAKSIIADAAFSMNTDVGSVTKSFAALAQAGVKVTDIGFSSFQEYQQFLEVTGTDAQAFAGAIGTMNKQMGMSNKQITSSIKSVAAIGKRFNIGREAIAGMADTVKVLNANSNLLPQNWSPAKMDKFLKGTTVVAGALTSVGLTADEAMAASRQLTQKLLEGSKGLAGMYTGLKDQLPDVYNIVTQNLGSVDDAFKMLSESPDQFMLKMGNLVDQVNKMNLDPQAMDRFRLQMEQTFGPEVMTAFNKKGFGKIGPAIEAANKPMAGQEKVLSNLASKYEDGRTHADLFAIAQDRVQTQLKKLHGVMSDTKYLKEYTHQSQEFVKQMSILANKGGPIGKATALLIDFKNRGVGGALAAHFKWGFALSEGMKVMQPFLAYLPALKVAFMALMNPIGLVAAAIAGLFFVFKDLKKGKDSIIRPIFDRIVKEAPKLINKVIEVATQVFDEVYSVLKSVDWNKVIDTVTTALTKVVQVLLKVIARIDWVKVGQILGTILTKAADLALMILDQAINLFFRIAKWLAAVDWGAVGKQFGHYLAVAAGIALAAIFKVFKNLPQIMVKIFDIAAKAIIGALEGIKDYLIEKFPAAAKPIKFIFNILEGAVSLIAGAFKASWEAIGAVVQWVWDKVKGLAHAIEWTVEKVGGAVHTIGGWISDAGSAVFGSSTSMLEMLQKRYGEASSAMRKSTNEQVKAISDLSEAVHSTWTGLKNQWDGFVDHVTQTASFKGIVEGLAVVNGSISKMFDQYVGNAKEQALVGERYAHKIALAYKASIGSMLQELPETAGVVTDKVNEMMNQLGNAEEKEVSDLLAHTKLTGQALDDAVSKIRDKYTEQSTQITQLLKDNHQNLMEGATSSTLAALTKIQEGSKKMLTEVNIKTSEAAGEIQKQFGVSADAALESVNQIAAIDPNMFRKNMAVVKSTFMGFLKDMDTQGKKLLDNTTKSFNTLWQTMNDGWKKHTDLLDTFTKKADDTITSFWQMIVDKAAIAATQLIQITDSITVALKAMFNNINLMDLLASPDQVTQWAASVVSALAYAFRTGGAADAMIGASYQKALAMAGEIQRSAGPATPDTSKNATSPAASSVTAASELLRTMNHPAWATDKKELIPSQLEEMNQNLQATLEALRKLAEGRASAPPRTPAPKPRIH